MSIVKDMSLAGAGRRKIEWVRDFMPALGGIEARFEREKPFAGLRIAVSVHLEAKTAYLAHVLRAGGAQVYCTGCNPLSTQDEIAAALADLVILTSDNPRTEDPEAILDQVAAGFPPGFTAWVRQPDRRAAIRQALSMGRAGDVILLAGKGHETEQEIGTQRVHLDEREEIASFFQQNTL